MKNRFFRSRISKILLVLSALLILILLIQSTATSAAPGHLATFAQGRIGLSTVTIGSVSIHPIAAAITNRAPVCLVLIAVEMQGPAFGVPDSGVLLIGSQRRIYPATSITPLGQDAIFGGRKIRAFGFKPVELCQQGELRVEDLALLIVHPAGVGVVSFAISPVIQASK